MAQVRFDIAEKLHLYFRVARNGSKTFTFLDAAGDPFDISGYTWQLNIRPHDSATNVIELTSGDGLTISTNTIVVTVTEDDTDVTEKLHYWELYDDTNNKTWLCGNAYFTSKDPQDGTDTTSVTVNTDPDTVSITISNTINAINGGTP